MSKAVAVNPDPEAAVMNVQRSIETEKERLAGERVRAEGALGIETGQLAGQPVSGMLSLDAILRRPHVHYE